MPDFRISVALLALFAALAVVVSGLALETVNTDKECEAKAGVVVKASHGWVCVKREVLL